MSKFVQVIFVRAWRKTVWALDDDGVIWECVDNRSYEDADKNPTVWKRLDIEREDAP